MNLEFEVNNIHNFKTNLFVVNNAIDNVELEKKFAKSRYKFGVNKAFGVQSIGHKHTYVQNLLDEFVVKFNYKQMQMKSYYLFIDKYKQQYTHIDNSLIEDNKAERMFASVIYLNKDNTVSSGTNLYDLVNDKAPFDYGKVEAAVINAETNKMIFYDGSIVHKPSSGFGNNIDNIRLAMTFFIGCKECLHDKDTRIILKNNNNHIQYKMAMIDNYYVNIEKVYRFFYKKDFYVNKNERDKKYSLICSIEYLLTNGHVNNSIKNNISLFEQLISQKIEYISSFFVSINNSLIFNKEENVWYGIIFINKVLSRNKLMLDCQDNLHDILHAKQNRLLIFNSKYKGTLEVFDNVFIEVIKIKIK